MNKSKKFFFPIVSVGIALAVIITGFVIWYFTASEYAHFVEVKEEVLDIAGQIGTGRRYFTIDTKRFEKSWSEMTASDKLLQERWAAQAMAAIQYANTQFGFSSSLYEKMLSSVTISGGYSGEQREENGNYVVTWAYAREEGLVVKYRLK